MVSPSGLLMPWVNKWGSELICCQGRLRHDGESPGKARGGTRVIPTRAFISINLVVEKRNFFILRQLCL